MVRYVYDFTDGGLELAGLLGGKGANLADMTRLGLPVPPGFTLTTEACRAFLTTGAEPDGLAREVSAHMTGLEEGAGRRPGQRDDPLLVSVRSGARFSMPGMMETILDVGLNDDSVAGLAKASGSARFAWDSYRRLVQMFGSTVMGVDAALFEGALERLKELRGVPDNVHLGAADLSGLVEAYKELIRRETGEDFPQSPAHQLQRAVLDVFGSWNSERARLYRRREHIPDDLGTAVDVQRMVFGNLGPDSGSGVTSPATRPPDGAVCTATTSPTHRARTSSPASATPSPSPNWSTWTRTPTGSSGSTCGRSNSTTATCATSSSPSSAESCGCCRPGWANAPPRRPSPSPPPWPTRASSARTMPSRE